MPQYPYIWPVRLTESDREKIIQISRAQGVNPAESFRRLIRNADIPSIARRSIENPPNEAA